MLRRNVLLVVDASPVVMAIWSLSVIWDIPTALEERRGRTNEKNPGSPHRSRRRGRTHVCTHARGRVAADPGGGGDDVPSGPEDRHAVGEGGQADLYPYARGPPPVPGDRGSRAARGHSAAAHRVTRVPDAGGTRMLVAARGDR